MEIFVRRQTKFILATKIYVLHQFYVHQKLKPKVLFNNQDVVQVAPCGWMQDIYSSFRATTYNLWSISFLCKKESGYIYRAHWCHSGCSYYYVIITIAHFNTITLILYLHRAPCDMLNTKKPLKVCTFTKKKAEHCNHNGTEPESFSE